MCKKIFYFLFLAFNDLLIEKGPLFHALFWGGSISMVVDSQIKLKKKLLQKLDNLSYQVIFSNQNHTQSFSILIILLFGGEMFILSFSPTHKYYIIIIILIYLLLYMYIPDNYFANHLKMVGADGVGPQYRY